MSLSAQTVTRLNWLFGAVGLCGLLLLVGGQRVGFAAFMAAMFGVGATVLISKVRVLKTEWPKWFGGNNG